MGFLNDNKKRIIEGARVALLFVWALALVIVVAGILNAGEGFRIAAALIIAVINVIGIVREAKDIREKFRTLYEEEK